MDKYKLKCETVRDLLPIYADKLTCEVTTEDIENHLADCKECREIFDNMQSEIPVENADEKEKKQIKYLKKLNRRTLKITGVILGCLVVIAGVIFYACAWGVSPKKSDLQLEYFVYIAKETGTESYTVDITLKNGKGLAFYGDENQITEKDGNITQQKIVYNIRQILPWFIGGENEEGKIITNSASLGFSYCGGDSVDSDELVLKCSDGDIVITVADIKAKGELLTEPQ
ncbi:MAG: zf-HC2 domain-containing protein [Ruminococcus sp.]|nr:zf-HC2 domain-containing protein [Ruminococcus sp.]